MMSTKKAAYEDYLDVLADKIEYKELDITECTFDFHVIELPHGGKKTTKKDVVNKKSICRIVNDDDICLSRSIITALSIQNPDHLCEKLKIEKLSKNDIIYIKKGRNLQKKISYEAT
ncbi:uncharacterized protein TNCT_399661 [Trichonephila clavata]|uniref:Uncharacterized protein n=1 Tax=Trichonephila clavata TaxID=2740835 RepID=A0A8X6FFA5_TRICU|nr:uncharacterized protein TNCT_399661 [Trichonephila clavata]